MMPSSNGIDLTAQSGENDEVDGFDFNNLLAQGSEPPLFDIGQMNDWTPREWEQALQTFTQHWSTQPSVGLPDVIAEQIAQQSYAQTGQEQMPAPMVMNGLGRQSSPAIQESSHPIPAQVVDRLQMEVQRDGTGESSASGPVERGMGVSCLCVTTADQWVSE